MRAMLKLTPNRAQIILTSCGSPKKTNRVSTNKMQHGRNYLLRHAIYHTPSVGQWMITFAPSLARISDPTVASTTSEEKSSRVEVVERIRGFCITLKSVLEEAFPPELDAKHLYTPESDNCGKKRRKDPS